MNPLSTMASVQSPVKSLIILDITGEMTAPISATRFHILNASAINFGGARSDIGVM